MKSDQNQDGQLSVDELPGRLKQSFKKLDLDSNGSLDKKELAEMEKANSKQGEKDPESRVVTPLCMELLLQMEFFWFGQELVFLV